MSCDDGLLGYLEAQITTSSEAGRVRLATLQAAGKDLPKGGQTKEKPGARTLNTFRTSRLGKPSTAPTSL